MGVGPGSRRNNFVQHTLYEVIRKASDRIGSAKKETVVENLLEEIRNHDEEINRIVVKNGAKIDLIPIEEIRYIQAEDDYVMIYSTKGRFLKKITMNYLEDRLPQDKYIRVHRSYIINSFFIEKLERYGKETYVMQIKGGGDIKTSKAGAKRLKEVLEL